MFTNSYRQLGSSPTFWFIFVGNIEIFFSLILNKSSIIGFVLRKIWKHIWVYVVNKRIICILLIVLFLTPVFGHSSSIMALFESCSKQEKKKSNWEKNTTGFPPIAGYIWSYGCFLPVYYDKPLSLNFQ